MRSREPHPFEDHRLSSQVLCVESESNQSRNKQIDEIAIPIPNGKNTALRGNLARHELTDEGAMEIISIANAGKEELIRSTSHIAENDIKPQINNA